jgi:uncharacterized protein YceH (UPF0502 family)
MRLSPAEGRIIGSLIEKQLTTPTQYPLTLNSLLLACNQSSNRDPVVNYDERTVDAALVSLKEAGLVRFVHPSHGRSVIRYRQVLHEKLGLDDLRLALVGVLLLRGPQTAGELRARTERMAHFDGIAAVEADLEALGRGTDPLALRLPRRPGQKEERWVQLVSGHTDTVSAPVSGNDFDHAVADDTSYAYTDLAPEGPEETDLVPAVPLVPQPPVRQSAGRDGGSPLAEEVAALRSEMAELKAELSALRSEVDELREVWANS